DRLALGRRTDSTRPATDPANCSWTQEALKYSRILCLSQSNRLVRTRRFVPIAGSAKDGRHRMLLDIRTLRAAPRPILKSEISRVLWTVPPVPDFGQRLVACAVASRMYDPNPPPRFTVQARDRWPSHRARGG